MRKILTVLLVFNLSKVKSIKQDNTNVLSSVGDSVVLHCPSSLSTTSSSPCPPACSWTGPANLSCTSISPGSCGGGGLYIEYNRTTCDCVLTIETSSIQNGDDWVCHMENERLHWCTKLIAGQLSLRMVNFPAFCLYSDNLYNYLIVIISNLMQILEMIVF